MHTTLFNNPFLRLAALAAAFVCLALAACGSSAPKLSENEKGFKSAWNETVQEKVKPEKFRSRLATVFPEELNMETHPGLIGPEAFTGPVFSYKVRINGGEVRNYVPDMKVSDYLLSPEIPESTELLIRYKGAELIPTRYLSDEKLLNLKKGKLSPVFAVIECTGYDAGTTYYYRSGNSETVYKYGWRTAFYSYPDCTLLGWEAAERPYHAAEALSTGSTVSDINNKRAFTKDAEGYYIDVMDIPMQLIYGADAVN